MITNEIINRFENKVMPAIDGCHYWTGTLSKKGYGRFHHPKKKAPEFAHRLSYKIYKGEIKPGLLIMHSCDNPQCVNPDHLNQGTNRDNVHDMIRKGRDKFINPSQCRIDLVGQVFGRLTVIVRDGKTKYWLCECSCGKYPCRVRHSNLRYGTSKSCGCLRVEARVRVPRSTKPKS